MYIDPFSLLIENNFEEFKVYLKYGDVNIVHQTGKNLLQYAVIYDRFEFALLLIENNISIDKYDLSGNSALHMASQTGKINFVSLFLKHKANFELKNRRGETAFHLAALKGSLEIIMMFLEEGINYSSKNNEEEDILFYAVKSGNKNLLEYLIKNTDLNLRIKNFRGESLLFLAVKLNNIDLAEFLLNRNVYAFEFNKYLETPLFYAVKNKNIMICELLINNGALIENKNKEEQTVFDLLEEDEEINNYLVNRKNSYQYIRYFKEYQLQALLKLRNYERVKIFLRENKNYPDYDSFNVHISELLINAPEKIRELIK